MRSANGSYGPLATGCLAGGLALAVGGPAFAHSGQALTGGFLAGFLHPLGGLDHLLAMVAVGLWGAFLGRPLIVALPLICPIMLSVGGVIGMMGLPIPPVELGIALSVLLLGLAIADARKAPVWAACLIVGCFGLFHGYAHGAELPVASNPTAYSAGFVLATGLLHLVGITFGLLNHYRAGQVVTRVTGAGIAVAGGFFLFQALS